jgi:AraC-like DNA-binding protein
MTPSTTSGTRSLLDRAERWRAELGDAFNRLAPEPLGAREPDGRLAGLHLGQLAAFQVSGTPQVVRRSRSVVAAAPTDLVKVCVQVRGRATVHQDGREIVVEPGQLAIYDTGRPYGLRLEHAWACAVLAFPRDALGLPEHVLAASMEHAYPLVGGPWEVLAGFVQSAMGRHDQLRFAAAGHLGEAGLHLIASMLSDAMPPEGPGSADADDARRLQVLAYVRAHLAEPDLSHTRVAQAHHMAPRTLHRLFEHETHTIAEYIRTQRLEAVRRDLADPLFAHRAIAPVAARWGFTDQAHFTRAYRARYGITPSVDRRASRPG